MEVKSLKNKDIKTVKKLAGKYENALKYIEKAREKKKAPNGRYWELPEWIIAILFGLSAVILLVAVICVIVELVKNKK